MKRLQEVKAAREQAKREKEEKKKYDDEQSALAKERLKGKKTVAK